MVKNWEGNKATDYHSTGLCTKSKYDRKQIVCVCCPGVQKTLSGSAASILFCIFALPYALLQRESSPKSRKNTLVTRLKQIHMQTHTHTHTHDDSRSGN